MPRSHPPYPPEFRTEAVRLVRSGERTPEQLSRDLGCSAQAIRNWVRQADLDAGRRADASRRYLELTRGSADGRWKHCALLGLARLESGEAQAELARRVVSATEAAQSFSARLDHAEALVLSGDEAQGAAELKALEGSSARRVERRANRARRSEPADEPGHALPHRGGEGHQRR